MLSVTSGDKYDKCSVTCKQLLTNYANKWLNKTEACKCVFTHSLLSYTCAERGIQFQSKVSSHKLSLCNHYHNIMLVFPENGHPKNVVSLFRGLHFKSVLVFLSTKDTDTLQSFSAVHLYTCPLWVCVLCHLSHICNTGVVIKNANFHHQVHHHFRYYLHSSNRSKSSKFW